MICLESVQCNGWLFLSYYMFWGGSCADLKVVFFSSNFPVTHMEVFCTFFILFHATDDHPIKVEKWVTGYHFFSYLLSFIFADQELMPSTMSPGALS